VLSVLQTHGIAGLVGLKFVVLAWVALVWRLLDRRYGLTATASLTVPQTVAALLNLVTILRA